MTAGDSLIFTREFALYSAADGWAVLFSFSSPDGMLQFNFPAVTAPDGVSFAVSVLGTTTTAWIPGEYQGQARATLTGAQTGGPQDLVIWKGCLLVLPDLSLQGDNRSFAKKTLDNLNLVIAGRATNDILNSRIEGTEIQRLPIEQIILLRDRFNAVYQREQAATKLRDHKGTGRNIYARLGSPRASGQPVDPYGVGYGGQRY